MKNVKYISRSWWASREIQFQTNRTKLCNKQICWKIGENAIKQMKPQQKYTDQTTTTTKSLIPKLKSNAREPHTIHTLKICYPRSMSKWTLKKKQQHIHLNIHSKRFDSINIILHVHGFFTQTTAFYWHTKMTIRRIKITTKSNHDKQINRQKISK